MLSAYSEVGGSTVALSEVLEAEQGEDGIHTWRWPCQRMSETKQIREVATQWGGPVQSGKVQPAGEGLWRRDLAWSQTQAK